MSALTRRRVVVLGALALAVLPALRAFAVAQVVTRTEITHTSARKIVWAWTSATGGTVSSTTTAAFDGKIIGLTTDPGATAPTDNYDVTITDSAGHDVLLGAGADRDTANTEHVAEASLGAVAGSKLTLTIANAGDEKTGVVILWIR
jgi:hypothetical protein